MTITIPTKPAELEDFLNDRDKVANLLKEDPNGFKGLITNYALNVVKKDEDLTNQIQNQVQLQLADFLKENRKTGAVPVNLDIANSRHDSHKVRKTTYANQILKQGLYNQAAPGAGVNKLFNEQADFFRALSLKANAVARLEDGPKLLENLNEAERIRNSFGTNVPADGGFLVPEEFRSDLLLVALENSIVRPRATVIPMGTQRTNIPAVDSTTNATSVFGGIVCSWVDEGVQPTETQGKFSQVTLDAKKLMAYLSAPNELVSDAPAFGGYLSATLPQAIGFYEDYAFMQGTGVGEPQGFINCAAAVIASAVTGQGANTIVVENLAAMFARMLPSSLNNAIWIASIDTFPQLALMAVSGTLGNSTPVWMNNGVVGAPPITIYGRPVYFTEKSPTLGTTGDIVFVDPSFYLVGDRQVMQATASPHALFNVDKTAYKIIERVDGRPWLQSAITPKNGGNTLSAFVQLSSTRT